MEPQPILITLAVFVLFYVLSKLLVMVIKSSTEISYSNVTLEDISNEIAEDVASGYYSQKEIDFIINNRIKNWLRNKD